MQNYPDSNVKYEFFCVKCDYGCRKKFLWKQHLATKKHIGNQEGSGSSKAAPRSDTRSTETPLICECGREYKYASGLSRHRKTCQSVRKAGRQVLPQDTTDLQALVIALSKAEEMKADMMEQLKEQNSIIREMVPCMGSNNTNNNFSINVFLNETCRDAINMSEFLASLQVQLDDLKYTQTNGLVEGISSVLVNGLRQLETCKRPIHCTDMKRETLYIKENNEWEKEEGKEGKMRLRDAIETVADKQRKAIAEWEAQNPGWEESEKGKDEYLKIVRSVMADVSQETEENRIIKNIAKETIIDR